MTEGTGPMLQPTGSVYLDTPARPPSRRPPVPRVNASRARFGAIATTLGLIGLTVAILAFGIRTFALRPDPIVDAFTAALDDPLSRDELERELARGIEDDLLGPDLVEVGAVFELDVRAEAERIAGTIADDPDVRAELTEVVERIHARAVVESSDEPIDLTLLTAAVVDVIETESPRLAALVPVGANVWTVDGSIVPDLTGPAALVDTILLGALAMALLLPVGVAVHPRRPLVASWIARWALSLGLVLALAAVGLPYLGGRLTGLSTVEVAIRSSSLRLLAPAALLGIGGMALTSFAVVALRRERRKVLEEGAEAAMGPDEPALATAGGSPTLDLAGRGLVDVNHPLTNI